MSSVSEGMVNASKGPAQETSLVAAALAELQHSPARYLIGALVIALITWTYKSSIPEMDGQEPQLIAPRIPFIGHLIGLVKNQSEYYDRLR